MQKRDWDVLFSKYDLRAVLQHQLDSVDEKVREVDPTRFERETDEYLSASVASNLVVSPLEFLEDDIEVSSKDAKIDVSHDPNRHFSSGGAHYVDGIEVTYHLPFRGDDGLLRCRPNRFTQIPPRAVIGKSELRFPYDQPNRDVAATKERFVQDLAAVNQWTPWVNEQVSEFNASLEERVRNSVTRRRAEITKTEKEIAGLGFKIRGDETKTKGNALPIDKAKARRAERREVAERGYDVALSFAGEDREYVAKVAESLQDLGVSVFYDRFEEVNLWGADLAEHFAEVYSRQSHFVVMFASRQYAEKAWPSHERRHALSRNFRGEEGRILPVRMDDTDIPGLPSTIGYLDARVLEPRKLAELIRQKLDAQ